MKKLLFLSIVLLFAGVKPAWSVAVAQGVTCNSGTSANAYSCSFGSSPTLGDLVFAHHSQIGATAYTSLIPSVSGGCLIVWHQLGSTLHNSTNGALDSATWWGYVNAVGASCTVTVNNSHTGTITTSNVGIVEISGAALTNPLDGTCTGTDGTAGTAVTCSSAIVPNNTDYVLTFAASTVAGGYQSGAGYGVTGMSSSTFCLAGAACTLGTTGSGLQSGGAFSSSTTPNGTMKGSAGDWNITGVAIAPPPSSGVTYAQVQTTCNFPTNLTSYTCTTGSNVTLNNLLVVEEAISGGSSIVLTAPTSGCTTGSMTQIGSTLTNPDRSEVIGVYYSYITSGGATCTVTATNSHSGTDNQDTLVVKELTGMATSSPVDNSSNPCTGTTAGTGTATSSQACGSSLTLTKTDLVTEVVTANSQFVWTPGNSFVLDANMSGNGCGNNSTSLCNGISAIETTGTSFTPAATSSANSFWNIFSYAIKPAAGGGAGSVKRHGVVF